MRVVSAGPRWRQPIDWDTHEEEEKKYVAAERLRLLYVAGTRAKDLLVVCRSADGSQNKAWREFEGYLDRMPALKVAPAKPAARKLEVDLSAKARAAADGARRSARSRARGIVGRGHAHRREGPPGGGRTGKAGRRRRRRGCLDRRHREPPCGRGAAWGSLLHGLLEHAMRHGPSSRADLARLARWLTVESPDLRPFIRRGAGLGRRCTPVAVLAGRQRQR